MSARIVARFEGGIRVLVRSLKQQQRLRDALCERRWIYFKGRIYRVQGEAGIGHVGGKVENEFTLYLSQDQSPLIPSAKYV